MIHSQVVQETGHIELKQADAANGVLSFNKVLLQCVKGVIRRSAKPEEFNVEGSDEVLVEELQYALLEGKDRVTRRKKHAPRDQARNLDVSISDQTELLRRRVSVS